MLDNNLFKKGYSFPKINDLIDVATLQQIQDWAAITAGVSVLIRDAEGIPVTKASLSNEFCNLISGEEHINPECRESNIKAAVLAAKAGKPQKYTCYAGLTQFAAPIQIDGHFLGTIVVGDRPTEPIKPEKIRELADRFNIDFDRLMEASKSVEIWSDETIRNTVNFLYTIANTLLMICYQGYHLNKNVQELTALLEISHILNSTMGLQEMLDKISEGIVKVLNVKASTIRLLDNNGVELVLKSMYNLSPDYLSKGPVILEEHPICKMALEGKTSIISDVTNDQRFGYNDAAKKEGLHTMLCTGLKSRDKAIGTIHLYTGEPHEFTQDELMLVQSIANQVAIAIENAKLYEQSIEKQRMERELIMAGEIQSELLPKASPNIEKFDLEIKFVPCSQLSGDLYDFISLDNKKVAFVIADVSGKGLPSAILMATTHATIRAAAKDDIQKSSKIISEVNSYLCEYTRTTEFVTIFYGVLDAEKMTLTYTNAGHNPPIIIRDGAGVFLEQGGIPAGIIRETNYSEEQIELCSGDTILLYTDGVTEAMNSEKETFGIRRLMNIFQKNYSKNSEEIIKIIYDRILDFLGDAPQSDDLTIMAIKVK